MKVDFSPEFITHYEKIVSSELNNFKVNKPTDFKKIQTALMLLSNDNEIEIKILNSNESHVFKHHLKCKISSLKEMIDHPEKFVEKPEDFNEFKTFVKTRIVAKIVELHSLTEEKKLELIEKQKMEMGRKENIVLMASVETPIVESGNCCLSEAEGLLETSNSSNIIAIQDQLMDKPADKFLLSIWETDQSFYQANFAQLEQMPSTHQSQILARIDQFIVMVQSGASIYSFIEMNEQKCTQILEQSDRIIPLLSLGSSIDEIVSLENEEFELAIKKVAKIEPLLKAGLSLGTVMKLDDRVWSLLIEKALPLSFIIRAGVSSDQIINLKYELLQKIMNEFMTVTFLLGKEIWFQKITHLYDIYPNITIAEAASIPIIIAIMKKKGEEKNINACFDEVIDFAQYFGDDFFGNDVFTNLSVLMVSDFSLQDLRSFDQKLLLLLVKNALGFHEFTKKNATFEDATKLTKYFGVNFITEKSTQFKVFLLVRAGIDVQTLLSKDKKTGNLLLNNALSVLTLVKGRGLTLKQVEDMGEELNNVK
jgi:hypothetical protein